MADILEHTMVPKHEILSPKERKEVLDKYGITKDKLPKILSSDPVIKKIGAKPGDAIRITRQSETAGTAVYYRVVVEA